MDMILHITELPHLFHPEPSAPPQSIGFSTIPLCADCIIATQASVVLEDIVIRKEIVERLNTNEPEVCWRRFDQFFDEYLRTKIDSNGKSYVYLTRAMVGTIDKYILKVWFDGCHYPAKAKGWYCKSACSLTEVTTLVPRIPQGIIWIRGARHGLAAFLGVSFRLHLVQSC
jgi:hypothetical protein